MNQRPILDITWNSILKVIITAIILYFLFHLRNILAFFIAALIISILFEPLVDFFYKKKIPRLISVVIVYLSFLGIFIVAGILFLPPLFGELRLFFDELLVMPEILDPVLLQNGLFQYIVPYIEPFLTTLKESLAEIDILAIINSIIGGIASISFIIVLSIFFSLENKGVERFLKLASPKRYEVLIADVWNRSTKKISLWFGIRIASCLFIGVTTFLTLLFMGVPHSLTLALIAGIFNFIPFIGPIFSAIFIAAILFITSPLLSIIFIGIFIILQFLENNIFCIILTRKIIKMPSSMILLSVVIGAKLWGVLGAILFVPLFAIIFEFLKEFLEKRKLEENQDPKFFLQQSSPTNIKTSPTKIRIK